MDDKTVLYLTKKRLKTLRAKSYSLEKLVVRTILKNVRFYLDIDDQLGQLKSLPGVLREKILQTLLMLKNIDDKGKTEELKDSMGIFPYLLSSRTRYIDLNGILSFASPGQFPDRTATLEKESECCVQLLQWIEALAPKVQTLIIKQNNPFPESSYPSDNKPLVKPEMLQSLKKMQNLITLRVDLFRFKKDDLLEMCKNLPNLHNLNILCDDSGPDPSPEVFTSSFCNVKEITFNDTYWLYDLCNQLLPRIDIVPFKQSEIFDWRRLIYDEYKRTFPRLSDRVGRQHIYLDLAGDQIRPKEFEEFPILFPNVSCLSLILLSEVVVKKRNELVSSIFNGMWYNRNENREVSLPKFDHIRQLNIAIECVKTDFLIFERILSTYGQNLQTLKLQSQYYNSNIDFAIIFKHCPKLEKLSLVKFRLNTSTLPREVIFTELKDLELRYPFVRNEDDTMILSNILSAPKLEKVVLEGARFNDADLLRLNFLIQEKQFLSQLHTFHFYINCYVNERLKYLTNVLKAACCFLPKLSDFRVGRDIYYDHPLLTCAIQKDDKVFDKCIHNLVSLFEKEK